MQERRRYVRSDGLVLVEYKGLQMEGKSSVFDISGVGLRITIDKQLGVGFPVKLEIYFPGDSQPIRAKGEVVWVHKCKLKTDNQIESQKEYFFTGVKFTDIDDRNRKKVSDYVYKKLRKEKK